MLFRQLIFHIKGGGEAWVHHTEVENHQVLLHLIRKRFKVDVTAAPWENG